MQLQNQYFAETEEATTEAEMREVTEEDKAAFKKKF